MKPTAEHQDPNSPFRNDGASPSASASGRLNAGLETVSPPAQLPDVSAGQAEIGRNRNPSVRGSRLDPEKQTSLAETHTEGLQFFSAEKPRRGRGCLLQIYPATVQAEMIRLTRSRTLIGRDLSCDVALEDTAVSRNHAAIESDSSGYRIVDLSSRNGTFVDDELLGTTRRLQGGELIRLGSTILKFMAGMDEEAQYHAVVHELMTRDALTGAYNRSFLMSTLERLIPRCLRTNTDLALIVIDIDFFKKVNDSFGHLVGDEVLRVFAERLRSALRPSDLLCRLGGEEFVIVSESTGLHDAVRVAERLRLMVSSHAFLTQAGPLLVTCSLGVVTLDRSEASVSVDQLLAEGDRHLYQAKHNGRNTVSSNLMSDTQSGTKLV